MNDNCVDVRSRERERLGKYTVEKLVDFFKSLEPKKSQQELTIVEQMFKEIKNTEMDSLEEKLRTKLFINGNEISEEDIKLYEESYKDKEICADSHPNIFKWKQLVVLVSQYKK